MSADRTQSSAAAENDPPNPALHPRMAEVFRQKATALAAALEHDGERDTARQALRGFIEKIVIPPGDGLLQVVGNFGEMLTAASGRNDSTLAAVGNGGCGGVQPAVLAAVECHQLSPRTTQHSREDAPVRSGIADLSEVVIGSL